MAATLSRSGRVTSAVLLAATLVLVGVVFAPLWKPLVVAAVLAGALAGLEERVARVLRGRDRAAGVLLAGLLLLVLVPLSLLMTQIVRQAIQVVRAATQLVQTNGMEGLAALAPPRLQPFVREQLARLPRSLAEEASRLASKGSATLGTLAGILASTGATAFQLVMFLIAFFFLLVEGPLLVEWLCSVSPLGADFTRRLLSEVKRTTTSVLASAFASAAVQALVATVGFALARVPGPLFFGALTFFASFLPALGSGIVGVPVAAVLVITRHFVAGGFLLAWTLLVTGMVDNVIKPLAVRGGTGLSGSVLFFSMIGGVLAFGGVGLLVGPGAVSLLLALARAGGGQLLPEAGPSAGQPSTQAEGDPART